MLTLTMAPFSSSVPVSHESMTVSQHVHYRDPDTETAKWNSIFINLIILTFAFPTVVHQNVF